MKILFLLIGVSLLLALVFLAAFFWAIRRGQHDDLYTPALRMLIEDDAPEEVPDPSSGVPAKPAASGEI